MGSKKITEFTSALFVALGDLIPFVSDPAGTAATKSITVQDLIGTVLTEAVSTRASLVTDKGKRLKSAAVVNYTVTHGVHRADDKIDFVQSTADLMTLVAGTNVTINTKTGLKMDGQHAQAVLICESTGATDVFTLTGQVVA